ncbi:MAG: GNAT family N-acetyltransferase [Thermoanaerobaculia bacterium]
MNGGEVMIRRGEMEDIPWLAPIERAATLRFEGHPAFDAFWRQNFSPDLFARQVRARTLWVATIDHSPPVGMAYTSEIDGIAHLEEIDVHPKVSGRGVGSQLLEAVAAIARVSGYRAITLATLTDVSWNAPFYAKRGFRILRPEELTPGLVRLQQREAMGGFPMHLRVIMRRELR